MKPRDLIRHTNGNGHERFWEIASISMGGVGEESTVELVPILEESNDDEIPTKCPMCILEAALETGIVNLYHAG